MKNKIKIKKIICIVICSTMLLSTLSGQIFVYAEPSYDTVTETQSDVSEQSTDTYTETQTETAIETESESEEMEETDTNKDIENTTVEEISTEETTSLEDGIVYFAKVTGFVTEDNHTLYYDIDGNLCYGWQEIAGEKYYFDNRTGFMKLGWQLIDGSYYYFEQTTGKMQKGIIQVDGQFYLFDQDSGERITGFYHYKEEDNTEKIVYAYSGGRLLKGLCKIDTKWYFFNETTFALESDTEGFIQDGFYQFEQNDYYIKNGQKLIGIWEIENNRYYFDGSGKLQTGFCTIGRKRYYFSEALQLPQRGSQVIGYCNILTGEQSNNYYFDEYGVMQFGWYQIENEGETLWHFFDYDTGKEDVEKAAAVKGKSIYYSEIVIPEEEKDNRLGTFKIHIKDVLGDRPIISVKAKVWSKQNGKDDIRTYNLVSDGNHNYVTTIDAKNHEYDDGTYCIKITITDKSTNAVTTDIIETEVNVIPYDSVDFTMNSSQEVLTATIQGARFNRTIRESGILLWNKEGTKETARTYPLRMDQNGNESVSLPVKQLGFSESFTCIFYTENQEMQKEQLENGTEYLLELTPLSVGKNGTEVTTKQTDTTYGLWNITTWASSPSEITVTALVYQTGRSSNRKSYTLNNDGTGTYSVQADLKDFMYISDTYEVDITICDKRGATYHVHTTSQKITSIFDMSVDVAIGINDTFKGRMQLKFSNYNSDSMQYIRVKAYPSTNSSLAYNYQTKISNNAASMIEINAANHGLKEGNYTLEIYGMDNRNIEVMIKKMTVYLHVSPCFIKMKNSGIGIPSGIGYFGIDVSHHQGTVNWSSVKNSGVQFAMIRDGYGKDQGQIDGQFGANLIGVKNQGLKWGVYHYSYSNTVERANAEATYCISILKKYGVNSGMVAFDFEEKDRRNTALKSINTQIILTFCNRMRDAGYTPYLYTDYNMFTTCTNESAIRTDGIGIWIARWKNSTAGTTNNIWQFYNEGTVNGISGNSGIVDLDFCTDLSIFNG